MSRAVNCDVCGGRHHDLMFMASDRLFGIDGEFPVVRCQDCGLIFLNPRPGMEELARYYPQDDYDLYNKAAGMKDRSMAELGRLQGPRKGRIETYRQPGRLLDIGFGDGSFMYFMKETGWDVTGVDFNEKIVELVTKELGIEARAGELKDAGFEDGAFDVVTLWGVLEHVQSPSETLAEIDRITGEDALVVVYTQNAAAPEAGLLGEDWFIYEAPRHLYSFNPDNLSRLLTKAGFSIAEMVYETPLYYCQMNWQYLKESRLGRGNDVVHNPTIIDRLAVKALDAYSRSASGTRWSSAMTAYAVKGPAGNGNGEPGDALADGKAERRGDAAK